MKIMKSIIALSLCSMIFVSCKDDKKDDDMNDDDAMEMNDSSMDKMEDNKMEKDEMSSDNMEDDSMNKMNEGMEMNLAEVAMNSEDLSTFVSAVQKAGMVIKIKGEGPFTIFAPTNDAFNKLPKGSMEDLMKPENKEKLEAALSYHIIPGNVDSKKLMSLIKSNDDNKYSLETANNGKIEAMLSDDGKIVLMDSKGEKIMITSADRKGKNGVIHSVNTVLMRK
jgi:uncharacterized surface protein with fasciclin (FAS1) repeats